MWRTTKMLTADWFRVVQEEKGNGPLTALARAGQLPDGVDTSDTRVVELLRHCRAVHGVKEPEKAAA